MSDSDDPVPDFSLLRDRRLVAYLWLGQGHLRRASRRLGEPLCEIGFANVVCFIPQEEQLLADMAQRSTDLEGFLFKARVEGLEIVEGAFTPDPRFRRF